MVLMVPCHCLTVEQIWTNLGFFYSFNDSDNPRRHGRLKRKHRNLGAASG